MNNTDTEFSRRDLLKGAVALSATGAAMLSTSAAAASEGENQRDHYHHHDNPFHEVVDTAQDCITRGNTCLDHCFQLLVSGEEGKEMAKCAEAVDEMLTMTNTLMELASKQSKHTKAFAALCEESCDNCADKCEPHADKHQACKECMDACEDCARACANIA